WQYGTQHDITWSDTLVTDVDLDYRVHPDSVWVPIATAVPASPPSYSWTIPFAPTTTARVRVRNASGPPADLSDLAFALTSPLFAAAPDTLKLAETMVGAMTGLPIELSNPGTAPLAISNVAVTGSEF